MARYLIINADDFGLSEGVSRGILKAHRDGVVTSTTFMMNFPWADELAPLLAEAPDLGVGVHLNLTTGTPVLPPEEVPTLIDRQGRFVKAPFHLRFRVDLEEARREWSAQVEKGIRVLGRLPTHLDTHKYLQGYPGFASVLIDVARTYNIPAVRCLYLGPDLVPTSRLGGWNPATIVLSRYVRRSAQLVGGSGLRCPGAIIAGDFDRDGLLRKLTRVGEGVTELVCHPGHVDEPVRSLSSLQDQREAELAALTDPAVRRQIKDYGIELVSFRHLVA